MEEWRDIPEYEGLYQVSNLGRIKSSDWVITRSNSTVSFVRKGKILKNKRNTIRTIDRGYLKVRLCKDGMQKDMQVHRAVAFAFIPNPDNLPNINHINNNPSDNRPENLEWCTQLENVAHTVKCGRHKNGNLVGESHGSSKLKNEQVLEIRNLRMKGLTMQKIADIYGITDVNVCSIINGKIWKHI